VVLTLNNPNKTISFHKNDCILVKNKLGDNVIEMLENYPDGYNNTDTKNQLWILDKFLTFKKIKNFFGDKDYGKIFCSNCFKKEF